MKALRESGDPNKVSAVETAISWMNSNRKEIFRTIFSLRWAEPPIRTAVRLKDIQIQSDEVYIVVQERQAGSATYEILEMLRSNVEVGGDTWECGDFGDVKDTNTGAMLRVSLSQFRPDWLPPLESPKKDCPHQGEPVYPRQRPFTFW